jgi:NADPH:quinone reductase-like Zn-dependent oxidoreductase
VPDVETMRAVVQTRYGPPDDVLELCEVAIPQIGDDEVLVGVRAASVHPDVWHVVMGRPYALRIMGAGLTGPKNPVPGTDVAGCIESIGRNVTRFRPGDEVFGETLRNYQWHNGGAFAEYVSVPEDSLALKPTNVDFEQAAAIPTSGLIALANLPKDLRAGQDVLINGAGGGVGAIALQLAKISGARVTGVDHTVKLEMMRRLGADRVIDYTRDDFTQDSERYDVILDVPGNRKFSECRRVLKPDGQYVLVGHDQFGRRGGRWLGSLGRFAGLMVASMFMSQLRMSFSAPSKRESMEILREHIESGRLIPMVARAYPLSEVVQAISLLQIGLYQGKIVMTV